MPCDLAIALEDSCHHNPAFLGALLGCVGHSLDHARGPSHIPPPIRKANPPHHHTPQDPISAFNCQSTETHQSITNLFIRYPLNLPSSLNTPQDRSTRTTLHLPRLRVNHNIRRIRTTSFADHI
ncbi:hypothetical protein K470DRAFT_257108 [Piedraia hortae CBS 480.64]|uniref:Uncharacterized protein n=1 Tax=Piedraia hortae CBS 480.64 TaxID=1314780 RepID=A0A6A7C122_9PEZI|nr:hypothetical protein K470DRAFT_257108 [Piedraia hortae CBS 480.64]